MRDHGLRAVACDIASKICRTSGSLPILIMFAAACADRSASSALVGDGLLELARAPSRCGSTCRCYRGRSSRSRADERHQRSRRQQHARDHGGSLSAVIPSARWPYGASSVIVCGAVARARTPRRVAAQRSDRPGAPCSPGRTVPECSSIELNPAALGARAVDELELYAAAVGRDRSGPRSRATTSISRPAA